MFSSLSDIFLWLLLLPIGGGIGVSRGNIERGVLSRLATRRTLIVTVASGSISISGAFVNRWLLSPESPVPPDS